VDYIAVNKPVKVSGALEDGARLLESFIEGRK
jgi:hypothetical protein